MPRAAYDIKVALGPLQVSLTLKILETLTVSFGMEGKILECGSGDSILEVLCARVLGIEV